MTVSTQSSSTTIQGNGVTTSFGFNFISVAASDIQVSYTALPVAPATTGVTTALSPSQYTLTFNSVPPGGLWGIGGTVVYPTIGSPIPNGSSITIQRILPLTQTTTISNQGDFAPQVIESALDTLCMEIQQISARTTQFRGTWKTSTAYNVGDIVQDGANGLNTKNYYICVISNTSGVWATDLANGDWSISVVATVPVNPVSLTGVVTGTSVGGVINTSYAGGSTGTGATVLATSPTITSPIINSATINSPTIISPTITSPIINQINGGPLAGLRNRIINGDMRIDQRYAGSAQTITPGFPGYIIDRWLVNVTGANCTAAQTTGTGGNQYAFQFNGASGVTQQQFIQRIEATNIYDLAGQTVTLSAVLANSLLTTVNWIAYYANSTNNFSAVTSITSGSFTVNSTPTNYSTQVALPTQAQNGVEIMFYVGAQTSGFFSVTDVQLEQGAVATPFERIPVGLEIVLCKRYMNKTFALGTAPVSAVGSIAGALTATGLNGNFVPAVAWIFPVEMFSAPSITTYNPLAAGAGWVNAANSSTLTSVSVVGASAEGANISVSAGTPATIAYYIHATAVSEL